MLRKAQINKIRIAYNCFKISKGNPFSCAKRIENIVTFVAHILSGY